MAYLTTGSNAYLNGKSYNTVFWGDCRFLNITSFSSWSEDVVSTCVFSGYYDLGTIVGDDDAFAAWKNSFKADSIGLSSGEFLVVDGLALAEMASEEDDFDAGYPVWSAQSVSIPGTDTDKETRVVPIGLGQTLDDTIGLTQSQVWAGSSSYVDSTTDTEAGTDTETGTDSMTLSDVVAAVKSIPTAIADWCTKVIADVKDIPQAIADKFTPSASADTYTISLKEFFPFCIPYDIYEMLSLLAADPVAPVFEWEIPVPGLETTFEIKVDLSQWDEVAAVFRGLELLCFTVGLAYVSREKFLRA